MDGYLRNTLLLGDELNSSEQSNATNSNNFTEDINSQFKNNVKIQNSSSLRLTTYDLLDANFHTGSGPNITILKDLPGHNPPRIHKVARPYCTELLHPSKLPEAFSAITSMWGSNMDKKAGLKSFVGTSDAKFEEIAKLSDLRKVKIKYPVSDVGESPLATCQMIKTRHSLDLKATRYKNIKLDTIPHRLVNPEDSTISTADHSLVKEGQELLYIIRVYLPMKDSARMTEIRPRFGCEIRLKGSQSLCALSDNIACINNIGLQLDVSNKPNAPNEPSKFTSSFLFINNVFYKDLRLPLSTDLTEVIRVWAKNQGLGEFPVKNMSDVRLHDLQLRLGYPEVYVHQGNCEHVLTFSEIRLAKLEDCAILGTVRRYRGQKCVTCARFPALWIVRQCVRIPYDPAYLCRSCFRLYLYKDGKKLCDFKAYHLTALDLEAGSDDCEDEEDKSTSPDPEEP